MNQNLKLAAAIQMVSGGELETNLSEAARLLTQASEQGAQLAVLPETFSMFSTKKLRSLGEQEETEGTVQQFLSEQSKRLGLWIVGGTTPMIRRIDDSLIEEERVRAACMVYSAEGKQVARYDKIHLFDVDVNDAHGSYRESQTMEPGDSIAVVDTPLGKLGLTVCYDLRFPELYIELAKQGAEIITVPSAFTARTGEAHWQTLLRARAIENLCYVIGADQGGEHTAKRETHGESMIVDPWGRVKASLNKGPGVVLAEIDRDYIKELRGQLPVHQHKRFEVSQLDAKD